MDMNTSLFERAQAVIPGGVNSPVRAFRAVGGANHANPVAIVVPCHRVVGKDGTLTGFGGGLDKKAWLLEHEGRHNRP